MSRPKLEVADIFRRYGEAWREQNAAHLSTGQRRVMSAIELCRTAALGGHVERCDSCSHVRVAYNSCRNRHCPKCQWRTAEAWLAAREAELLPVPYFHVVFTLPAAIGAIAYQNKAKVYGLLFTAAAEALTTIAADPRPLAPVPARLFLDGLARLHAAGELQFFNDMAFFSDADAFRNYLTPLRRSEWVVYAKRPFAGPEQVLAYLARYTHRVAIGNGRLISIDYGRVAFRWKDYREVSRQQSKVLRLDAGEFMRRFLLHVLPDGFHRIRHYGLFANGHRAEKLALCRKLLQVPADASLEHQGESGGAEDTADPPSCPCCGGRMRVIETFERGTVPRSITPIVRFDTS